MSNKTHILLPIFIAAVAIGIFGMITIPKDSDRVYTEFSEGKIKIDDIILDIKIVNNQIYNHKQLQNNLHPNNGLFFILDDFTVHRILVHGINFPIDVIWFDNMGNITHLEKNVKPCKSILQTITCKILDIKKDSKYILEVAAGFIDKFTITVNSKLKIISI